MSIAVYTVWPAGTATSLFIRCCSTASASAPLTMYLENELMSNSATPSRQARCSAPLHGSQFCWPKEYSISGATPGGAKKLGRSQPILLPKLARASRRCAYSGERRKGRAVSSSRLGQGMA